MRVGDFFPKAKCNNNNNNNIALAEVKGLSNVVSVIIFAGYFETDKATEMLGYNTEMTDLTLGVNVTVRYYNNIVYDPVSVP